MVCLAALAVGCTPSVARLDSRERQEALMREAEAHLSTGDLDAAVSVYRELVATRPLLARAHLDLAMLLDDRKKDYVSALYHYRRYLELRPRTEKKELIESRIRAAEKAFAGSVFRSELGVAEPEVTDSPSKLVEAYGQKETEVARLEQENTYLKRQIEDAEKENRQLRRQLATARARSGRSDVVRTYRVKRGDTLTSIAAEIYNDAGKWRIIREANAEALRGSDVLPVGKVLVIP